MVLSYRLKKKELIFLLDLFGDVNTLYQKFGVVYIDDAEHTELAKGLHKKGMVTVSKNTVTVDHGIEFIMKKMYSSDIVFSDDRLDMWCYCCDDFIVVITVSKRDTGVYLVTPIKDIGELFEKLEECEVTGVSVKKGVCGEYDITGLRKLLSEFWNG